MPKKTGKSLKEVYLEELTRLGKESHVYRKYQLIGLEVSEILGDERHKALYIKLAKERGTDRILALAKDVATRGEVKNKGAYFMAILAQESTARVRGTEGGEKKEATERNGQRKGK